MYTVAKTWRSNAEQVHCLPFKFMISRELNLRFLVSNVLHFLISRRLSFSETKNRNLEIHENLI